MFQEPEKWTDLPLAQHKPLYELSPREQSVGEPSKVTKILVPFCLSNQDLWYRHVGDRSVGVTCLLV